ncbi:DUF2786 domain-containing protein [Massilia sp. P8910]|uniref:DUF2786 domain-containing protein n=1 Tax=Massilia antarctica TaxID=2765360 RepID=UPI001E5A66FD|nr:DUF2786 domain-containing protein [Massilia antarctica]MCE3602734.1 DUF2786 domain-containing protein [Massilia antarctica]
MDKNTALRKIQKCLALSKSSEPHEAAQAMKQAQALMRQFDIDHPELLAVGIEQQWSKSRATSTPPAYEVLLADVIAKGFGCDMVFVGKWASTKIAGGYTFLGAGAAAEVAAYTFTILARRLTAARTLYTKTALTRYRKNKVAAADEFCIGWVCAMRKNVTAVDVSADRHEAISAYKGIHFPDLAPGRQTTRALANSAQADQHHLNGWLEGKKARVHAGIAPGGRRQLALA